MLILQKQKCFHLIQCPESFGPGLLAPRRAPEFTKWFYNLAASFGGSCSGCLVWMREIPPSSLKGKWTENCFIPTKACRCEGTLIDLLQWCCRLRPCQVWSISLLSLSLLCYFAHWIVRLAINTQKHHVSLVIMYFCLIAAELGDCDPLEHNLELVSEFRFIPNQTEDVELAIYNAWKECR